MLAFFALAFFVVPVLELVLFVNVAGSLGVGPTLLLMLAVSVGGAWLVRHEGTTAWRRVQERLAAGEVPTTQLVNGVLVLFAGALLLTPGFLTDVFGLSLLFPPTRALYRRALVRRYRHRTVLIGPGFGFGPAQGAGGRGTVWDAESWEEPPDRPQLP